jgi:phosphoglycerate dehydrogenase-like enzyme
MGNASSQLDEFKAKIVVVGPKNGEEPSLAELVNLPSESVIAATGKDLDEIRADGYQFIEGNILLNVTGNAEILAPIIREMPDLVWVHSMSAGVEHIVNKKFPIPEFKEIVLTNAKGVFSSSLAEYVMTACGYFSKDIPRLINQKKAKIYNRYTVDELKGQTMGIVGCGDIGSACARLAKCYGMNVIGLRKRPEMSKNDVNIDKCLDSDCLVELMQESDFVVVTLALTDKTRNFIDANAFASSKKGQILINIARGGVIDEDAMIKALHNKILAGAALDVFETEPLPESSPLWDIESILLSPHCADYTSDGRKDSIKLFVS